MKSKKLRVSLTVVAVLIFSFSLYTGIRALSFKKTQNAQPLSAEESFELTQFLLSEYPDQYQILKKLPYIEEIVINILYVLSLARKNNDFSNVINIKITFSYIVELGVSTLPLNCTNHLNQTILRSVV